MDRTAGLKFNYRVIFDLSFFMWFGIILFNIITGIIVDTFSELRICQAQRIPLAYPPLEKLSIAAPRRIGGIR